MSAPALASLGFALAVCYIPGWTGFSLPTGWILLSVVLPWYLVRPILLGTAHWLGLTFLLYAFASLAWAPVWQQGVFDLWLLCILAGAFCLGSTRNVDDVYIGLAFGIGVSTVIAIFQLAGWTSIEQLHKPGGLFYNPGVFGEVAALITVALFAIRIFWPMVFTIPAIVMSGSRIAILACAFVALFRIKPKYVLALVIPLLVVVTYAKYVPTHWLDGVKERVVIWQNTMDGLTPIGRGAGSFVIDYPAFASRGDVATSRPENAHNDYLEMAFEFGIGALPLLGIIILALDNQMRERFILVAFLFIAVFSFPRSNPVEGFIGAMAMGSLCGNRRVAWRNRPNFRRVLERQFTGGSMDVPI